jgi:putative addiction module component (TIGR02574 family)
MKLQNLSTDEKILLVEELWDSIASDQGSLEITEAQRQELDIRLAAYEADKEPGEAWEIVKERIA